MRRVLIVGGILTFAAWLLQQMEQQADAATPDTAPIPPGGSMGQQAVFSGQRLTQNQQRVATTIVVAATDAGLSPAFMLALAVTESSLNPLAVGDDGRSIGLFQLLLSTARAHDPSVTPERLMDAATNARLACQEMRRLIRAFPGHTYGDYAEAWTLGGHGKFNLHRSNPTKVRNMERAAVDLALTLDLNERPTA